MITLASIFVVLPPVPRGTAQKFNRHYFPFQPGASGAGSPKEKIMSKTRKFMAIVFIAFITAATFVGQNAHAGDPGSNPSSNSGEPGNNPSGGGNGNPAPRNDNAPRQNGVVYSAASNGKIKLERSGYGAGSRVGGAGSCRLCQLQQFQ
jgi:hypothetical protein